MGFNDGIYWQVTDQGQIYRSGDRTVWATVDSGTTASLRGIAFLGTEVLICGASGLVLSGGPSGGFQAQALSPPTSDWLEAIATSTSSAVAVGDEAAVYLRTDASTWRRVPNLPFTDWLRGVAYGAGTFVAVGENGLITTSPDGHAWQALERPVATHLNRVVFASDAFYACGNDGVLLKGTKQGSQWDRISLNASEPVYAYAAKPAGPGASSAMELVAGDLLLRLKSRPNGSWDDQLATANELPAPAWSYYTSIWDGERFLVAGRTGMLLESLWASTGDGPLWLEPYESPRDWLWEVIATSAQYIAVGDQGAVLTSENGIEWYQESLPLDLSEGVFLGIGGSSNLVVAAGSSGSLMFSPSQVTNILTTNSLVTLVDCVWQTNAVVVTNVLNLQGLLWYPVLPAPTPNTLQGVAERDGLIVVVGDAGTILTSRDGSSWVSSSVAGQPNLSSVAAFERGFVATGDDGVILFSPDGGSWEHRSSGTTDWIYRVRHLDGLLIAVGQNGLIQTSTDGSNWQPRSSGTEAWLNDVTRVDNRYYVCGAQGTLLASTNAVDWAPETIITGKSLFGLASRGGQLVAVGVEGVILRTLTDAYSDVQIVDYEHDQCETFLRDQFVLHGRPDQAVAIERSFDLMSWDPLGQLRLSDAEATFTLLRTNTAPATSEFFRAVPFAP